MQGRTPAICLCGADKMTALSLSFDRWTERPHQLCGVLLLGFLLSIPLIMVPLPLPAQMVLSFGTVGFLLLLSRRAGRRWTLLMMVVSALVSSRYLWWRITETMALADGVQTLLSTGLLLAEIYGWVVMLLGYVQSAWPLGRKPVPLPADLAQWPHVDVLIPTYNENLEIVRNTVWAAMDMDWPRDRLHVHLLDDGDRAEFREFAARCGINYIARPDNAHAKAGNLNHALALTNAPFVAVFDCDHVPNRAFLQMTMGGFIHDPRLALVQTPHHFYSPDPVQRNLKPGRQLANEGLLFYGLVQDGNDLWDSAFFCGSCAVLRREALADIGGFAVETVTEDAHTALRLHRYGWNSAYLRLPLAAGLATETLSAHLGQRARWARGMNQIFRTDNPLFGRGLSWAQRVCYLNAMLHFFFPLPRIVVLTAPLAYLLLNINVMVASAAMVVGYAGPHLLMAVATNQRMQGRYRSLFWGEVYETILAFHLLIPTIITLINPKKGRFNVTDKGGLLGFGFFDRRSVLPQIITILLLLGGYGYGIGRSLVGDLAEGELGVLLINMFWALFNIMILGAAAAAGLEKRQARRHVRIGLRLPLTLHFPGGKWVQGTANDISMGGANLTLPMKQAPAPAGTEIQVELSLRGRPLLLPARIMADATSATRIRFADLDENQLRQLVLATFGRADAWLDWDQVEAAGPVRSLRSILASATDLFLHWLRRGRRAGGAVAGMAGLALLSLAGALPQPAQAAGAADPLVASNSRQELLPLSSLAPEGALTLRGVLDRRGLDFTIRRDEVPTAAALRLSLGNSPALISPLSHLKVMVNGEMVGNVALSAQTADGQVVEIPIDPMLLRQENRIGLEFVGHYANGCEDPLHSSLWAMVNANSALRLSLQRLALTADLSLLPRPFFDDHDRRALNLPFVLGANPSDGVLRAAGIVASWFGAAADFRPAHFPSYGDQLPDDHAVIVATPDTVPPGLNIGPVEGPTIAVIPNPLSPSHRLLLVLGRTEEEMGAAALALALGGAGGLTGDRATVRAPVLGSRQPYDAPRWIPTGRKVRLSELAPPSQLQGQGMNPGPVQLSFAMAPDLFVWRGRGVPVDVRYRYPGGNWLDLEHSRLDVSLNGVYVDSLKLREDRLTDWFRTELLDDYQRRDRPVRLPPYLFYGRNRLDFYYNLYPVNRGECQPTVPDNLRIGIDADTEIDFTNVAHFTAMPNLALLASAGFPFTRMADLGESLLLLPERPQAAEIEAALDFLGAAGAATGYPVTRVQFRRGMVGDAALRDRDLVLIGDFTRQPLLQRWAEAAPVWASGSALALNTVSPLSRLANALNDDPQAEGNGTQQDAERALVDQAGDLGVLMSFQSPLTAGRTVVAVTGTAPSLLPRLVAALRQPTLAEKVQGDLVIMNGGELRSFQLGPRYWVGQLDPWTRLLWLGSRHSLLVLLAGVAGLALFTLSAAALLKRRARQRLALSNAGREKK